MILRYGDTGRQVEDLHNRLIEVGHLFKGRYIDGVAHYDRVTDTTIRRIQRDAAIAVDGIYGPQTQGVLDDLAMRTIEDSRPKGALLDQMPHGYKGDRASWSVLKRALRYQELGAREMGGNNRGRFVRHFFETAGSPGRGDWCSAFVCTAAKEALGEDTPLNPAVWVTALYVRALGAGIFRYTTQGAALVEAVTGERVDPALIDHEPQLPPGACCIEMHWTIDQPHRWKTWKGFVIPGHTYLVHHREEDSPYYFTLEGNVGRAPAYVGPLMRRVDDADLLGYFKWSKS